MQIIPRHELKTYLRRAGLNPVSQEFAADTETYRLTVRELTPPPFTSGPNRKVAYPDGRIEGPFPVVNRPALAAFVAEVFAAFSVERVLAVVPEGNVWLNNKAQSGYLHRVPDAQTLAKFLRSRGLTNRFQGGFCIAPSQFSVLPVLAAQPFVGGADVLFASLLPLCRLTALSCHHFDVHFTAPDSDSITRIAALAENSGLCPETLALPDLPDVAAMWE